MSAKICEMGVLSLDPELLQQEMQAFRQDALRPGADSNFCAEALEQFARRFAVDTLLRRGIPKTVVGQLTFEECHRINEMLLHADALRVQQWTPEPKAVLADVMGLIGDFRTFKKIRRAILTPDE